MDLCSLMFPERFVPRKTGTHPPIILEVSSLFCFRKKLTEMSTEEFFEHGFDSDVSTGDEDNVAKGSDSPKKLDIKQR